MTTLLLVDDSTTLCASAWMSNPVAPERLEAALKKLPG